MASTRRRARTATLAVGLAWAVAAPGLSTVAEAAPPPHAAAHREDHVPPGQARMGGDAVDRVTASTATTAGATADTHPGRGVGRGGTPPGQARKATPRPAGASTPDVPATPTAPEPAPPADAVAPPPWSPERPAGGEVAAPRPEAPAPTAEPAPTTSAPAPTTPVPAVQVVDEAAAAATPSGTGGDPDTTPAEPDDAAAAPTGARVRLPDVAGRIGDLLADVGTTIQRAVPAPLDVPDRPLAELVPVLLAVLGAFLALQRGLGQGLGHVPMTTHDPVRRGY